jgi:hypothetical protein
VGLPGAASLPPFASAICYYSVTEGVKDGSGQDAYEVNFLWKWGRCKMAVLKGAVFVLLPWLGVQKSELHTDQLVGGT